ncbi:hypothetical protein Aab01nite_31210 [Paractinoplanes abujensis]|uniref:Uncharacterized protein n=1 Tax=Paractinoplanes abujensis TaxID=882441 RepID=A0A7W7D378_9ACTN|nr:hypothetical protein [Actinoplanes abujensis]MBB4697986.1 hypothetical protein [Actinoplanes abujensis]GID19531.1 hypothetical protein Aab01nite_31210 [Actinoplanes abujensis]
MTAGFGDPGPEPRGLLAVRSGIEAGIIALLGNCGTFATVAERDALVAAVTERYYGDLAVERDADTQVHLTYVVRGCVGAECLGDLVAVLAARLGTADRVRLFRLHDEWNAAANFDADDWWALRSGLQDLVLTNLRDLYLRSRPNEFLPLPAHCMDAWHAFVHLAGLNGSDERVPPCTIFLWLVTGQLPGDRARPLRGTLDRLVRQWGITGPFQRASFGLTQPAVRHSWDPTLLIAIDFDRPGRYSVVHWTQWAPDQPFNRGAGRLVPRAGLEAAVTEIVASAETLWPSGDGGLRLEFLLPLELLNLPVEQWSKENDPDDGAVPLYRHYPVVVRSLDRIRDPRRRRAWNQRWGTLRDRPGSAEWLASRGAGHKLEEAIRAEERIVTMILSEPPPGASDGAAREIRIAIRTGVPIVIWHRTERPSPTFLELVENLIVDGGMAELPDRASRLRITTSMNEDDRGVGQGLVLLWDDPSRLPGEFDATAGER